VNRTRRDIVFPQPMYARLLEHLFSEDRFEQVACVLCGHRETRRRLSLLARELVIASPDGLSVQGTAHLSVKDSFSRSIMQRCREENLDLIEVHSHPFSRRGVRFSAVDVANERQKFPYLARKIAGIHHATMVFGRESVDAHMWDSEKGAIVRIDRVKVLGSHLKELTPSSAWHTRWPSTVPRKVLDRLPGLRRHRWLDRQVRAVGRSGQQTIQSLHVAVVGCGGMGSIVSELLVRSGVRRLILVDHDRLEISNLNRFLAGYRWDAVRKRSKVRLAARQARRVNLRVQVRALKSSVCTEKAVRLLKEVDIIFGCTDSQGSRLVLNRLATQYYIPYIDCGTGLVRPSKRGPITEAGGQIRIVLPGGYCLECIGGIDREAARDEMMTGPQRAQRLAHGYGLDPSEPAPQVMCLNMAIAAHAVGEFLKMAAGLGPCHTYVLYDLLGAEMKPVRANHRSSCVVCGEGSPAGLGDKEPLWLTQHGPPIQEVPSIGRCAASSLNGR